MTDYSFLIVLIVWFGLIAGAAYLFRYPEKRRARELSQWRRIRYGLSHRDPVAGGCTGPVQEPSPWTGAGGTGPTARFIPGGDGGVGTVVIVTGGSATWRPVETVSTINMVDIITAADHYGDGDRDARTRWP